MSKFARHLRVGVLVIGLPALVAACASGEDKATLEQISADSAAASAAADRADEAADRAAAAAEEATQAAAAATEPAEKTNRIAQRGLRK
jgi:hypothetical protein